MRKSAFLCILVLTLAAVPGRSFAAFTFEVHPGIYNEYEYTDNYRGDVRDAQSESIYYVGPSLAFTGTSETVIIDLTGRYTKSFHNRFPEDDSPEVVLSTQISHTIPRLATSVAYDFSRSLTRDTLSEPFGENRTHTGSIDTTWEMTQTTSLDAGYGITVEDWFGEATDEDVTTHNGALGMTHRLSPRSTFTLATEQSRYDYETSQDVIESNGSLRFEQAVLQALNMGFVFSYNHGDRGDLSDEDRYDARLTGSYAFPRSTTLDLEAGNSWLVMEDQDRESMFVGRASLEKAMENDRFSVSISKEYTSEYTTDRYGTYDTASGTLGWEKDLLRGWTSALHYSIDRRRPTRETLGEEETDATGSLALSWNPVEQLALNWNPIEYLMLSVNYEHLRTKYEISGTARENRYRVMAEVRF